MSYGNTHNTWLISVWYDLYYIFHPDHVCFIDLYIIGTNQRFSLSMCVNIILHIWFGFDSSFIHIRPNFSLQSCPQWGTAGAEIKVPPLGAHCYQRFPLCKPGVGILTWPLACYFPLSDCFVSAFPGHVRYPVKCWWSPQLRDKFQSWCLGSVEECVPEFGYWYHKGAHQCMPSLACRGVAADGSGLTSAWRWSPAVLGPGILMPSSFAITPSHVFHVVWNVPLDGFCFTILWHIMWLVAFGFLALGRLSACLLPAMSQWEGIHWRIRWVLFPSWQSCSLMCWVSRPSSLPMKGQSVRNTVYDASVSLAFSSSDDSSTAQAWVMTCVDSLPVGMDLDLRLPSGNVTKTPPPLRTALSAEPSRLWRPWSDCLRCSLYQALWLGHLHDLLSFPLPADPEQCWGHYPSNLHSPAAAPAAQFGDGGRRRGSSACWRWRRLERWMVLCLCILFLVSSWSLECNGWDWSHFIFSACLSSFSSRLSSSELSHVAFSRAAIGVVLRPPVTMRAPEFWIWVSLNVLLLAVVMQTVEAYSMWGRPEPVCKLMGQDFVVGSPLAASEFLHDGHLFVCLVSHVADEGALCEFPVQLDSKYFGVPCCGISSPSIDSLYCSFFLLRERNRWLPSWLRLSIPPILWCIRWWHPGCPAFYIPCCGVLCWCPHCQVIWMEVSRDLCGKRIHNVDGEDDEEGWRRATPSVSLIWVLILSAT